MKSTPSSNSIAERIFGLELEPSVRLGMLQRAGRDYAEYRVALDRIERCSAFSVDTSQLTDLAFRLAPPRSLGALYSDELACEESKTGIQSVVGRKPSTLEGLAPSPADKGLWPPPLWLPLTWVRAWKSFPRLGVYQWRIQGHVSLAAPDGTAATIGDVVVHAGGQLIEAKASRGEAAVFGNGVYDVAYVHEAPLDVAVDMCKKIRRRYPWVTIVYYSAAALRSKFTADMALAHVSRLTPDICQSMSVISRLRLRSIVEGRPSVYANGYFDLHISPSHPWVGQRHDLPAEAT